MWTEFLPLWLAALLFAIALMALVWRLAVRICNAGIVDIAWSAVFAPLVPGCAGLRARLAYGGVDQPAPAGTR